MFAIVCRSHWGNLSGPTVLTHDNMELSAWNATEVNMTVCGSTRHP